MGHRTLTKFAGVFLILLALNTTDDALLLLDALLEDIDATLTALYREEPDWLQEIDTVCARE